MPFDLSAVREQFPALAATDDGVRRIHFDNPAGTQVPASVVEAMSHCLLQANANLDGHFRTSHYIGAILDDALLSLRFQNRCGRGLNQRLPFLNGHEHKKNKEINCD